MINQTTESYGLKLTKLKKTILNNNLYLALVIGLGLIVIGLSFGWYNNRLVPLSTNPVARYKAAPHNPLSFMSNWDGPDYLRIATKGYDSKSLTNFFPLYPIVIYVVNFIIGSPLDSALLISWVCLVGLVYFYLKIVDTVFSEKGSAGLRAVLLLLLFPTAVFFLATYTESMFAVLALGSIYFALNKKYLQAAALALPMSATHITSVFVLGLIGLIMLEQKAKLKTIVATLVTGSLGLIAYMIYLTAKFKAPLAFITSQESHGWLSTGYRGLASIDVFNVVFIVLLIIAAIYWWKKRLSFALYSLMFLLIPLVGQQFGGFNRYVLMAFPVPLMLYAVSRKRPNLYIIFIVMTTIAWTYTLLQYAGGYIGS